MSPYNWPRHVAILSEDRGFAVELADVIADGFRSHDCRVDVLRRTESWIQAPDFVLGYGPHTWEGSLLPTAQRLASYPKDKRPFFYWWFTEGIISRPKIPTQCVRIISKLHAKGNLHITQSPAAREKLWAKGLNRLFLQRHFRLRAIGELYEFHSRGLLGGLAATAPGKATYFQRHGFEPIVAPIGYHSILHGRDLGLDRDIDVGFLGRINTKRRLRLLEQVRKDMESRGIKISIPTEEVNGEERTRFLNRVKIILNILQRPHDFSGLRLMFCAANKALMISEPLLDNESFVPGHHMIATPIEQLAETIEFYLSHEEQRQEIVEEAYRFVSEELTIHQMVGRILNHSRELFPG